MPRLREKKFRGTDLNEGNVQTIFKQCLSISNPKNAIYIYNYLENNLDMSKKTMVLFLILTKLRRMKML